MFAQRGAALAVVYLNCGLGALLYRPDRAEGLLPIPHAHYRGGITVPCGERLVAFPCTRLPRTRDASRGLRPLTWRGSLVSLPSFTGDKLMARLSRGIRNNAGKRCQWVSTPKVLPRRALYTALSLEVHGGKSIERVPIS